MSLSPISLDILFLCFGACMLVSLPISYILPEWKSFLHEVSCKKGASGSLQLFRRSLNLRWQATNKEPWRQQLDWISGRPGKAAKKKQNRKLFWRNLQARRELGCQNKWVLCMECFWHFCAILCHCLPLHGQIHSQASDDRSLWTKKYFPAVWVIQWA